MNNPTYTFERACMVSFHYSIDYGNPNRIVGDLEIMELPSGTRRKIKYCKYSCEETYEEIQRLREYVYPVEPGKQPPPTIAVEVVAEFDNSLRLVSVKLCCTPEHPCLDMDNCSNCKSFPSGSGG